MSAHYVLYNYLYTLPLLGVQIVENICPVKYPTVHFRAFALIRITTQSLSGLNKEELYVVLSWIGRGASIERLG